MIETAEKLIEKLYNPVNLEFMGFNIGVGPGVSEVVFGDPINNKMYIVTHKKQVYYVAVYQLDGPMRMFSDDAVKEMLDGRDSEKSD